MVPWIVSTKNMVSKANYVEIKKEFNGMFNAAKLFFCLDELLINLSWLYWLR